MKNIIRKVMDVALYTTIAIAVVITIIFVIVSTWNLSSVGSIIGAILIALILLWRWSHGE